MLAGMENITLTINGMKCTGCSQRVERALKNTDGIKDASVDLDSRKAKISYNKDEISVQQICETITDVGFGVEEKKKKNIIKNWWNDL